MNYLNRPTLSVHFNIFVSPIIMTMHACINITYYYVTSMCVVEVCTKLDIVNEYKDSCCTVLQTHRG